MTAVATEDTWLETCLIAIAAQGGSDVAFAGLVSLESMDFELGEKDFESQALANGGRVKKWTPEGDSSVTFDAYPLQAGTDTGTTGKGFFDLLHAADGTVPVRITNTRARTKYRVLFLWTNDATATTAQSATAENYSAIRIGMADGYFTSVKTSFTDGVMKFSVTYKCSAFDKAGNSCVMMESAAGSSASDKLPAVAAYTSSNKFG